MNNIIDEIPKSISFFSFGWCIYMCHPFYYFEVFEMSEKNLKKRLDFQNKIISRQLEQIENLKLQIENLKQECKNKDIENKSVELLRKELTEKINEIKHHKNNYKELIEELRKMKSIINQDVYKNRWWLIKFLLK